MIFILSHRDVNIKWHHFFPQYIFHTVTHLPINTSIYIYMIAKLKFVLSSSTHRINFH